MERFEVMPKHVNGPEEEERPECLRDPKILDTPVEESFDRIARLAQRLFGVPFAGVSLVEQNKQWLRSAQGPKAISPPSALSFCQHTVLFDEAMVVEDALVDPRFVDSPLVTQAPHFRFYAGQPLKSPEGDRVGTLCVIDTVPRLLEPRDIDILADLGALVEAEFGLRHLGQRQLDLRHALEEAERRASIDPMTQTWNRRAILKLLRQEIDRGIRANQPVTVAYVDLDKFKPVNDTYGHKVGDVVLQSLTQRMRSGLRSYDAIGRLGGDEFLLVIPGAGPKEGQIIADRVMASVVARPVVSGDCIIPISVSIGLATHQPGDRVCADSLIDLADQSLYMAKRSGRGRVCCGESSAHKLKSAKAR